MQAPPSAASQRKCCPGPGPSGQPSLGGCSAGSCRYRGKCKAGHCPQGGHTWAQPGLSLPRAPLQTCPHSYLCWLLFLVLKGHCSGCGLPGGPGGGVARKILGLPRGAFPQTCVLHPSDSGPAFTFISRPEELMVPSGGVLWCRAPRPVSRIPGIEGAPPLLSRTTVSWCRPHRAQHLP